MIPIGKREVQYVESALEEPASPAALAYIFKAQRFNLLNSALPQQSFLNIINGRPESRTEKE
jgi:hypothetical protein